MRVVVNPLGDAVAVASTSPSRGGRQQPPHPHDVVRGGGEGEDPGDEWPTTMAELPEPADGLHPAEALFDQFAFPLTDGIARMARGPLIDRTAAAVRRRVLRQVRGGAHRA